MTRRTRGVGLQQLIKELESHTSWDGGAATSASCQTSTEGPHEPRSVDPSKIARVSLAAVANQAKPLRGVMPSRHSKVPGGGRSWFTNRALAHVRTPGGPTSPTQQLFRVARTSPNLCARPSLTRSNRRGTGPVCPVVWEGWRREASPYPDRIGPWFLGLVVGVTSSTFDALAGAQKDMDPEDGRLAPALDQASNSIQASAASSRRFCQRHVLRGADGGGGRLACVLVRGISILIFSSKAFRNIPDISRLASDTRLLIVSIWQSHISAASSHDRPLATARISASRCSSRSRRKMRRSSSDSTPSS